MKETFTKKQIQDALKNLKEKLPDQDEQNITVFQVTNDADISYDYTRKSFKRVHATNCRFDESKFIAAAGIGARFANVHFTNCDFSGSNFQYCYFSNTNFTCDTLIKGANFSHSIFTNCHFSEIHINESTFFDCQFQDCTFLTSNIRSVTFENSVFYNCTIIDTDLSHLNLEYTHFSDVSMEGVTLSPYQVAYIIGMPTYLRATKDKVYIYTDKGKITALQYNNLIDDLVKYYYSQNDFFPLANIMISLTEYDKAMDYIQRGMRESFDYLDFRMVKHYCRLAISCSFFSHTQLRCLYELITDLSYKKELNVNALHSYLINIGEIRELLLNRAQNMERVEFVIKTNIDKDDLAGINDFYNKISDILKQCCSEGHIDSIELRHNSPYELLITCIDTLPAILTLISTMYALLVVGSKALDVYQKFGEARKIHQQNSLYKYDKRLKELEIMEKEQKMLEKETGRKQKGTGIILVSEVEHSIKCSKLNLVNDLSPEYLHYKYILDIPESK